VAPAIRSGQPSAIEIVEAQLGGIDKFNPALNTIVTLDVSPLPQRPGKNHHHVGAPGASGSIVEVIFSLGFNPAFVPAV